jgi:hypothetical protein
VSEPQTEPTTEPTEPAEPPTEPEAPTEPQGPEPTQEPDVEPTEPQEPAQEPVEGDEPAVEMRSEKELEKAFKAIDKLREHVANRLGVIMGEDAQALEPCPVCGDSMPGFVWPAGTVPLSPEKVGAVSAYIGLPDLTAYQDARDAKQCPDCKGLGDVKTYSLVPGNTIKMCSLCVGKGFVGTGVVIQPEVGIVTVTNGELPAFAPPVETALPPEAEALRRQGFLVIPPSQPIAV